MTIWKKWIYPCLITSTALTAGALWFKTDSIEQDIAGRIHNTLGKEVAVKVEGRNVTLINEAANSALIKRVENIDGVRGVQAAGVQAGALSSNTQTTATLNNDEATKQAAEKTKQAEQEARLAAEKAAKAKDEITKKAAEQAAQFAAERAQLTKAIEEATTHKAKAERMAQETQSALNKIEQEKSQALEQAEQNRLAKEEFEKTLKETEGKTKEAQEALQKLQEEKQAAEKQTEELQLALENAQSEKEKIEAEMKVAQAENTEAKPDVAKPTKTDAGTNTTSAHYFITLKKNGEGLELSGLASNDAIRSKVVDKVRKIKPNVEIDETLIIDDTAEDKLEASIEFGLAQLERLQDGQVTIESDSISIFGDAKSLDNFEALSDSLKDKVNANLNIAKINIKAPKVSPYLFAIDYDGDTVHLTGFVPDEDNRNAVKNVMNTTFPGIQITENLQIASGEPNQFLARVKKAASRLSLTPGGVASIADTEISIEEKAGNRKTQTQDQKATTVPAKKSDDTAADASQQQGETKTKKPARKFKLAENQTCQELFDQLLQNKQVNFEPGKAVMTAKTLPVLKTLVRIAERCPNALLQISGHTDSDGNDALNQSLSLQRAKAVRNYLSKNGISGSRLLAIGYGAKRPIASNATEAGKTKNRRIEFQVIEQ